MTNENTFQYTYSAPENQEILSIRNKYLPRQESKLDELKRLDSLVQNSGVTESLSVGIGLAMEVIGEAVWLGILLGLIGGAGMLFAYPVHRRFVEKAKNQYTPRILELIAELTGNI